MSDCKLTDDLEMIAYGNPENRERFLKVVQSLFPCDIPFSQSRAELQNVHKACEALEKERTDLLHLLAKERDDFGKKETELKKELKKWQDNSWTDSKAVDDRDFWKAQAEKMAEALKKFANGEVCDNHPKGSMMEIAKEDLQSYDKARGQQK